MERGESLTLFWSRGGELLGKEGRDGWITWRGEKGRDCGLLMEEFWCGGNLYCLRRAGDL